MAPRACSHVQEIGRCLKTRAGSRQLNAISLPSTKRPLSSNPTRHRTFYQLHMRECPSQLGNTNTDGGVARAREASLFPGRALALQRRSNRSRACVRLSPCVLKHVAESYLLPTDLSLNRWCRLADGMRRWVAVCCSPSSNCRPHHGSAAPTSSEVCVFEVPCICSVCLRGRATVFLKRGEAPAA